MGAHVNFGYGDSDWEAGRWYTHRFCDSHCMDAWRALVDGALSEESYDGDGLFDSATADVERMLQNADAARRMHALCKWPEHDDPIGNVLKLGDRAGGSLLYWWDY